MSKPELKIEGIHKLRDYKICIDYINGNSPEEIVKKRSLILSIRRIFQILYKNSAFINPRISWPKTRRIQLRQRILKNTSEDSRKDIVDQINDLDKAIDGEKPLVNVETHTHYDLRETLNKEQSLGNRIKDFAHKLSQKNRG